jgi:hypothetical protein
VRGGRSAWLLRVHNVIARTLAAGTLELRNPPVLFDSQAVMRGFVNNSCHVCDDGASAQQRASVRESHRLVLVPVILLNLR